MSKRRKQLELLGDLIRIARAESVLPPNRDIATVRARIERELGGTVSQRQASEVLGVSQPGLRRWIESGDIPLVVRVDGTRAVPVSEVVGLALELDDARQRIGDLRYPLESVMADRMADAKRLTAHVHILAAPIKADPNENQSSFARLYNAVVASRLDAALVGEARQRLWRLHAGGHIDDSYVARWEHLLERPSDEIAEAITSSSDVGGDLRQNSPFDGSLSHHERQVLLEALTS